MNDGEYVDNSRYYRDRMSTFESVTRNIVKYIEAGDWESAEGVLGAAFATNGSGFREMLLDELENGIESYG